MLHEIPGRIDRLIQHDRHIRPPYEFGIPGDIPRGKRLLDHLHAKERQFARQADGPVVIPPLIGIHPDRLTRGNAHHLLHHLQVGLGMDSGLDLESVIALRLSLGRLLHRFFDGMCGHDIAKRHRRCVPPPEQARRWTGPAVCREDRAERDPWPTLRWAGRSACPEQSPHP